MRVFRIMPILVPGCSPSWSIPGVTRLACDLPSPAIPPSDTVDSWGGNTVLSGKVDAWQSTRSDESPFQTPIGESSAYLTNLCLSHDCSGNAVRFRCTRPAIQQPIGSPGRAGRSSQLDSHSNTSTKTSSPRRIGASTDPSGNEQGSADSKEPAPRHKRCSPSKHTTSPSKHTTSPSKHTTKCWQPTQSSASRASSSTVDDRSNEQSRSPSSTHFR